LREISSPPLILFMMGERSILQQQNLAIVGARDPTPTGLDIAYQLASELCEQQFVIISGLAKGIDGAAHRGALLNRGTTMAVLGSGLEHIYPACHQTLAMDIVEKGGTLISEFFPYSSPKAEFFPRRNRIISGMSLGVIVVEATLRSGSLITARYALEQGREVFAVPGSIRNPLSQGCHALLKEGATLIETYEDVIQGLSFLSVQTNKGINDALPISSYKSVNFIEKKEFKSIVKSSQDDNLGLVLSDEIRKKKPFQQKKDLAKLDSQDVKLLECLGFETTSIDSLMARTGLAIVQLLARLSALQLKGYIDVVPGGYVRK
jgi:DNA processing protein